jgi:hypothetical protein
MSASAARKKSRIAENRRPRLDIPIHECDLASRVVSDQSPNPGEITSSIGERFGRSISKVDAIQSGR